jgi:hypothetical protein
LKRLATIAERTRQPEFQAEGSESPGPRFVHVPPHVLLYQQQQLRGSAPLASPQAARGASWHDARQASKAGLVMSLNHLTDTRYIVVVVVVVIIILIIMGIGMSNILFAFLGSL